MAYALNGFEVVLENGRRKSVNPKLLKFSASRGREVAIGMFAMAESDGTYDGAVAADLTHSSGIKVCGLIAELCDAQGRPLDVPYAGTATEVYGRVWDNATDLTYEGVEDGDGGVMTASTAKSVAPIIGAVTQTAITETFTPNPVCHDKLDSSTASTSADYHGFNLVGVSPDVRNVLNNTNKVYRFKLSTTFYVQP